MKQNKVSTNLRLQKISAKMSFPRRPPNTDGMHSLKVDNLSYRTTPDDLRRAFDKYGDVGDIYLPRDRFVHITKICLKDLLSI